LNPSGLAVEAEICNYIIIINLMTVYAFSRFSLKKSLVVESQPYATGVSALSRGPIQTHLF